MRYETMLAQVGRGRDAERKIRAAGGPAPADRRRFESAVAILDQTERDLASGGLGFAFVPFLLIGAVASLFTLMGVATYQGSSVIAAGGQAARESIGSLIRVGGWLALIGVTVAGVVASTPRLRRAIA